MITTLAVSEPTIAGSKRSPQAIQTFIFIDLHNTPILIKAQPKLIIVRFANHPAALSGALPIHMVILGQAVPGARNNIPKERNPALRSESLAPFTIRGVIDKFPFIEKFAIRVKHLALAIGLAVDQPALILDYPSRISQDPMLSMRLGSIENPLIVQSPISMVLLAWALGHPIVHIACKF
jgi:hypothetical protein